MTDTISFTCSACGHTADFPKAQVGKAIYCPKCQAAQVVKAPGGGTDRFRAERIPTGRIVKADATTTEAEAEAVPHGMAGTARIDFICGACNHTSRISAALSGQPVRCPTCGTVQLAGVAGLRVVRLDGQGKLPFTCTACSYQARLNSEYSGKAIRCPKCQGAQVVPRILRDPSGAHPAIPSGAPVVRSEPGTGSIKRPATGSFSKPTVSAEPSAKRPATGSFAKPTASAEPVRSEPSAALRTPAGGIAVAQPMPTPTPLPGSLATPPPGSLRVPQLEPTSSASAMALPSVPTDDADSNLDLGDGPAPAASAEPAPARPRGGVVRRSGRMNAQRTPQPGDEPTLEAARAVQPEPDHIAQDPVVKTPLPAASAPPAPTQQPAPSRAKPAAGHPAWLVPALGVAAVVAGIASLVLLVMLNAASGRESGLQQQLTAERKHVAESATEIEGLKQKLIDSEAGKKLITSERDELRSGFDAMRRDHELLKAEAERLKAEAAAAKPQVPAGKPLAPANGQPAGK